MTVDAWAAAEAAIADDEFLKAAESLILELRAMRERQRAVVLMAGRAARNRSITPLRRRGYGLTEIADAFGISRERVRMLERQALAASEGQAT